MTDLPWASFSEFPELSLLQAGDWQDYPTSASALVDCDGLCFCVG